MAFSTHYYTIFLTLPLSSRSSPEPRWIRDVRSCRAGVAATVAASSCCHPSCSSNPRPHTQDIVANRQIVVDRAVASGHGAFASAPAYARMLWSEGVRRGHPAGRPCGHSPRRPRPRSTPAGDHPDRLPGRLPRLHQQHGRRRALSQSGAPGDRRLRGLGHHPDPPPPLPPRGHRRRHYRRAVHPQPEPRAVFPPDRHPTLAQHVIERDIPPGATVLVQPYSVALTQSRESLVEALQAHIGDPAKASTKFALRLALDPYPSPAYRTLYLGDGGMDVDKIYLELPGRLRPGPGAAALRQAGVQYVVLKRYNARKTLPPCRFASS